MAHFTLKILAPSGVQLFETDFTLHELIPLVRQITRKLARHRQSELPASRAVLTPQYGSVPSGALSPYDLDEDLGPRLTPATETGGLLQILAEDLEAYAPVVYHDELTAFYHPGTSPLCLDCPERGRCPGAGNRIAGDLTGWIELDPDAPRSDAPLSYLSLRIEDGNGAILYREHFHTFQFFAEMASRLLCNSGRLVLPTSGGCTVEIRARYEGEPRIDPPLALGSRQPIVPPRSEGSGRQARQVAPSPVERPRRLVDWDRLEGNGKEAVQGANEEVDLEIRVVAVEAEALQDRPMPSPDRSKTIGEVGASNLRIFLHRTALTSLNAVGKDLRDEIGGLLVGDAFRHPADARPYVEVMGVIPVLDEAGRPVRTLSSGNLRTFQDRLKRDFPERRLVGWFRFHLLGGQRISLYMAEHAITTVVGKRLALLEDESFLHRNFFPQPWHIGLIVDPVEWKALFYHLRDGEIVPSNGYFLVD